MVLEFLEKEYSKKKYFIPKLLKDRYQLARDIFTTPEAHTPETIMIKKETLKP